MHNNNKYNARRIYYVRRGGGMDRDGGRRKEGGRDRRRRRNGLHCRKQIDPCTHTHTLARRVSLLGDSLELECVRVLGKYISFF